MRSRRKIWGTQRENKDSGMIKRHKANTWLDKAYRDTTNKGVPFRVKYGR